MITAPAHRPWATRLPDLRFTGVDKMLAVTEERKAASSERVIDDASQLRVVATTKDDILLRGPNGGTAHLTNHSFNQLAALAGAPARYVAGLPAGLLADNLNHGLAQVENKTLQLLTFRNGAGDRILRALTSERYSRVWDAEFTQLVHDFRGPEWNPPKEFERGVRTCPDQTNRVNSGLYLSDRSSEIFLVDDTNGIPFPDGKTVFFRGLRFWNSEVGGKSFGAEAFLFVWICGNRMIFGKQNLLKVRRNHIGDINSRYAMDVEQAFAAANELDFTDQVERIKRAMNLAVAANEEEAVSYLRQRGFTKKESERAVRHADVEEGGFTNLWQLVQGITAAARLVPVVEARSDLEDRAAKLLDQKVLN